MSKSMARTEPGGPRELNVRDGVERIDSASARLVYVYLTAVGGATVDDLCENLELTRLTALSLLKNLKAADLVTQSQAVYTTAAN